MTELCSKRANKRRYKYRRVNCEVFGNLTQTLPWSIFILKTILRARLDDIYFVGSLPGNISNIRKRVNILPQNLLHHKSLFTNDILPFEPIKLHTCNFYAFQGDFCHVSLLPPQTFPNVWIFFHFGCGLFMKIETTCNLSPHWTAEAETKLTSASFSNHVGILRLAVGNPDTDLKSIRPTCRPCSCFHLGKKWRHGPRELGGG